jgi:hypothetical protein
MSEVRMTDLDKYLNMLKSPKSSIRYDACEELRVATESSPEVILALEEATRDENKDVAERARLALAAEVHQHLLIIMGRELPKFEAQREPEIEPEPEQPAKFNKLALGSIFLSVFTLVFFSCLLFLLLEGEAQGKARGVFMIEIVSLFFFLIAVLLSVLALIRIIKNRGDEKGLGIAIFGLIFGILVTIFNIWLIYSTYNTIQTCWYC